MIKRLRVKPVELAALGVAIICIAALSAVLIFSLWGERKAVWVPDYPMEQLFNAIPWDSIENGERELGDRQYELLLMQTGLGKSAVNKIMKEEEPLTKLEEHQQDFFNPNDYVCGKIGIITYEERNRNGKGLLQGAFDLADIQDGDILLANTTHSLGWRHGHAGIVIDAKKQKTLEAVLWGEPSIEQDLSKWETYARVMVLRVKEEEAKKRGYDPEELKKSVAEYVYKVALNINYGLLTGVPDKAPDELAKTQCAHLVWYAYNHFGLDLDSDGGWLVTPKDIANSDLLEIVQVYGVNPKDMWP